jgi:hypothetical protein
MMIGCLSRETSAKNKIKASKKSPEYKTEGRSRNEVVKVFLEQHNLSVRTKYCILHQPNVNEGRNIVLQDDCDYLFVVRTFITSAPRE